MKHHPVSRRRPLRRAVLVVAVVGIGAMLAGTVPAGATMYSINQRWTDSYSDHFTECGLNIHLAGEASGVTSIREGKGKDAGAFFVRQNAQFTDTYMNVDNGKYLTFSGKELLIEPKATPVGGSVFEFVTAVSGQPFVVTDMFGNVVLRDRGRIAFRYLFDTGGDNVPGGTNLELIDVATSGPHPSNSLDDAAFCAMVVQHIG